MREKVVVCSCNENGGIRWVVGGATTATNQKRSAVSNQIGGKIQSFQIQQSHNENNNNNHDDDESDGISSNANIKFFQKRKILFGTCCCFSCIYLILIVFYFPIMSYFWQNLLFQGPSSHNAVSMASIAFVSFFFFTITLSYIFCLFHLSMVTINIASIFDRFFFTRNKKIQKPLI